MARPKRTKDQGMTAQEWAAIKFKAEGPAAQRAIGSRQDWIKRAEADYPTILFATKILQYDDDRAFDMVVSVGPDAALEFLEALGRFRDAHKAVAQFANAAHLRMIAAMSRLEVLEAESEGV